MQHERRSLLSRALPFLRGLRGVERWGAGALGRGALCFSDGGLRNCRSIRNAWGLLDHSGEARRRRRFHGASACCPDHPGKSALANPCDGLSASGRSVAPGSAACSKDDPGQLRVPNRHLVLADGGAANCGHYRSRSASIRWQTYAALETLFRAAAIEDPDAAANALLAQYSLNEALVAERGGLESCAGSRAAGIISAVHRFIHELHLEEITERVVVPSDQRIASFLSSYLGFRREERLVGLYLDAQCRLITFEELAIGSSTGVECDFRRILLVALQRGASGIILAHNHPSGSIEPSHPDRRFTRNLREAARLFGITLLDHVIVAHGQTRSIIHSTQDDPC